MAEAPLTIRPGGLALESLRRCWSGECPVELADESWSGIDAAHRAVARVVDSGSTVYGINTGFGSLARQRIGSNRLGELQRNLVMSHSAGVGEPLGDAVVRLVIVLKIASLGRGHSGVSRDTVRALLTLLERRAYPEIPSQGSVGASGDLAPLAHLSACLMGEGRIRVDGELLPAAEALGRLELSPLELGPKEGLALLNGTQVSTALALAGLFRAERVLAGAIRVGAMTVDAVQGSDTPFDPRIHELRGHPGQADVARCLRRLLEGSQIRASHIDCDRVQDPYCIRCQPQVLGACLDLMRDVAARLLVEANAVTDNPLVFPDDGEVLSGGNFHAEPVALAADQLALALAEIGNLSERRIAMLVDPAMSGLPAFLVVDSGLNSGFMIAHVTAAALASENRQLSHPASVDTIPTSANQEDHVSMATHGARRLLAMADNATRIVAVESLAAAQGIEFHRPQRSSPPLEALLSEIRGRVESYRQDRYFAPDIDAATGWIDSRESLDGLTPALPLTAGR